MSQYTLEEIASQPIFFERNRVFRVYQGGKLFHEFFGDAPEDGNLPEEWVCSAVHAMNRVSAGEKEGVSRVAGTDVYLDDLIAQCPRAVLGERDSFGVLVKILDSAIRLPMQAHPDKPFSRRYFNSEYGKAEMWVILATRPGAKIYFGFRDKLTREDFQAAVEQSETDRSVMETLVNEVEVKPGDVFFIPAKMVHAIGAGCLLLEVQEPTDFTVQPERWCGDYRLDDFEMYLGLDKTVALDCFDYSLYGMQTVEMGRKQPRVLEQTDALLAEQLVGPEDTPCFGANRYRLQGGGKTLEFGPSVQIVTEGSGVLTDGTQQRTVKKGDYFLLPAAAAGKWRMESDSGLTWVECLPPM